MAMCPISRDRCRPDRRSNRWRFSLLAAMATASLVFSSAWLSSHHFTNEGWSSSVLPSGTSPAIANATGAQLGAGSSLFSSAVHTLLESLRTTAVNRLLPGSGDSPTPSVVVTISSNGSVCLRRLGALPVPPRGKLPTEGEFLPGVKSPCWLQELTRQDLRHLLPGRMLSEGSLLERASLYAPHARDPPARLWVRCLPYFYLLGAAKSATTDLYRRLRMHPDVSYNDLRQDPQWWNNRRFDIAWRRDSPVSFDEYLDMQEPLVPALADTELCSEPSQSWSPTSRVISGDNTPFYLHDGVMHAAALLRSDSGALRPPLGATVAAGLAAVQPGARLIIILREPGDRLFSEYIYFRPETDANKTADAFHEIVSTAIQAWNDCRRDHSEVYCVNDPLTISHFGGTLPHISLYVMHVQIWLDAFPRDQVLVLRTEDYARDRNSTLLRAFEFLDLDAPTPTEMARITATQRMNKRRDYMMDLEMLPKTRQMLTRFFKPFNKRLATLLRSDAFLWSDAVS